MGCGCFVLAVRRHKEHEVASVSAAVCEQQRISASEPGASYQHAGVAVLATRAGRQFESTAEPSDFGGFNPLFASRGATPSIC